MDCSKACKLDEFNAVLGRLGCSRLIIRGIGDMFSLIHADGREVFPGGELSEDYILGFLAGLELGKVLLRDQMDRIIYSLTKMKGSY